jgi:hypothetical protein
MGVGEWGWGELDGKPGSVSPTIAEYHLAVLSLHRIELLRRTGYSFCDNFISLLTCESLDILVNFSTVRIEVLQCTNF